MPLSQAHGNLKVEPFLNPNMTLNLAPKHTFLKQNIERLAPLVAKLKLCQTWQDKCAVLTGFEIVKEFLEVPSFIRTFLAGLSVECEVAVKSVIAIGQATRVFSFPEGMSDSAKRLRELVEVLLSLEHFYTELGGIVGYHLMMLQFLFDKLEGSSADTFASQFSYHQPRGVDISMKNREVMEMIRWGLENMDQVAEIYPVGGAADRLRLFDEQTKVALPAARLQFLGKSLLEGLIEDLQAREYLYYKLFKKQICTPVAMMTSKEKDNHAQIMAICEEKNWFGRTKDNFFFFCQSSVPTMNQEGQWCLQEPLQLLLKPGGHGVIWKLARDQGGIEWLFQNGRKKALVRQINNPIAACDYGLLAFIGVGCQLNKAFGFASCPRFTKASEGMNILLEKAQDNRFEYVLTNVEYCDFARFHLVDEPVDPKQNYSKFSSNTNILFADLKMVLQALSISPIPGMLINLKRSTYQSEKGEIKEEEIARLESTMQNIADAFVESFNYQLDPSSCHQLKTYLTYNHRHKTISAIKREYTEGLSLLETPEGCFLDIQKNAEDLLINYCSWEIAGKTSFLRKIPFLFLYHPALGPLYSIIAQKLGKSRIHQGSELQLQLAEVHIIGLDLQGSLIIQAEQSMGHYKEGNFLNYSEFTGKCVLKQVKVENQGIDWDAKNTFWKGEITRKQCCYIQIKGNGEFYAENVILQGNLEVIVEDGMRVTAYQEGSELKLERTPLKQPSWWWNYRFNENSEIVLEKTSHVLQSKR